MRGRALAGAVLLCAGCLGSPPPAPQAGLAVEVLRGLPPRAAAPRLPAQHVALLVDVSHSMDAPAAAGVPRYRVARAAAARLAGGLPDALLDVVALGAAEGACAAPSPLGGAEPGQPRDAVRRELSALAPAGEGSLAAALDVVRARLPARGARVAVFTDLDEACGGDLCAAARALVDAGARLELVVVGEAAVPACLAALEPGAGPPPGWPGAARPPPPFVVESHPLDGGAVPSFLAAGEAGGRVVPVPPGAVTVVVDLVPPVRVGPMQLSPGATTRIEVVEFQRAGGRVREWAWQTRPGAPQ